MLGFEEKLKHVAAEVTKSVMEELDFTKDIEKIVHSMDYSEITKSINVLGSKIDKLIEVNMRLTKLSEEILNSQKPTSKRRK